MNMFTKPQLKPWENLLITLGAIEGNQELIIYKKTFSKDGKFISEQKFFSGKAESFHPKNRFENYQQLESIQSFYVVTGIVSTNNVTDGVYHAQVRSRLAIILAMKED